MLDEIVRQRMYNLRERSVMAPKWLLSFLHREWKLAEYPVRVRSNGSEAAPDQQWLAQILNWPGPAGVGATKEQAIAKLGESLESIRAHRRASQQNMPRPGSRVPIQFASTARVLEDPEVHDDFIIRVLGFAPGSPVFISDQSSLGDFGDEAHVAELQTKISEIYGVDVSDLKDGLLCDILQRIRNRG